ncbi:MAG: UDP-glucose--hexose-1-phosphate uridylyltransferase [Corynebacterium sp.]|nr:UDP-glucose--hexose-1-phosphate uridylyltransferase [Corynebacterium sp.]
MKRVDALASAIIAQSDYTELDRIYLRNRLFALIGEDTGNAETQETELIPLVHELGPDEILTSAVMDFITPPPHVVNAQFWNDYAVDPQKAISNFYSLNCRNDYIKLGDIARNIEFTAPSDYGDIEITINLSKPEKDPKAIAAAKNAPQSDYPLCQLCMENEGYAGRVNHPARAQHRIIRVELDDENKKNSKTNTTWKHTWGFQYSPYAYFNEHCIFLDAEHSPMEITTQTFRELLQLVDLFPGYFAGSNSDLPIVGGSILSHNHYQGGRHIFPMDKASTEYEFTLKGVKAEILKWPMSVIRLRSDDPHALIEAAEHVAESWKTHSDETVDVIANSNGTRHHTVTPIARKDGDAYILNLVLRDNHTSEEHPDGVFHPHKDVQHIKKENIGLIEVMGLAILPPRLKEEMAAVERYLQDTTADEQAAIRTSGIAEYHLEWARNIKAANPQRAIIDTSALVKEEIGHVFVRVLEDAGVFKCDEQGRAAFHRFLNLIGES